MKFSVEQLDFKQGKGLIPAIIQDNNTNQVLMMAYMNQDALQKTLDTKMVTFYSRSKKRLWTKGETSGNFLYLVDIKADCDQDTLLLKVKAPQHTCHLARYSCFNEEKQKNEFLKSLFNLIKSRKKELPKNSYVASLFTKGKNCITQKVGEEAVEVVIAALSESKERFISESADLLFHVLVLAVELGVSWDEVIAELEKRSK